MPIRVAEPLRLVRIQLGPNLVPMAEEKKGRAAVEMGPTAAAVAANARRLRERRGMSTYEFSRKLREAGRPITPSAVAKIERGERRVDVDDLATLAAVLNVSPAALLLPLKDSPHQSIEITGAGEVPADVAWEWASNKRPLRLPEGDTRTELWEYQLYSLPPGMRSPRSYLPGERDLMQLARTRMNYETLAAVGPRGTAEAALAERQRRDPEPFAPEVTEYLRGRGMLPVRLSEESVDG